MMKIPLDSVILVDHLNGVGAATSYLSKVHLDATISAVTRAEVLAGYDEQATPPSTNSWTPSPFYPWMLRWPTWPPPSVA
jgi:hypothetical protein